MARPKEDAKKELPGKKNGISRRSALKMGAAAGAVTVLTSRKSTANAFMPPVQSLASPPPAPVICSTFSGSPATRPFMQQLPIPTSLQPTTLNPAPTLSANTAAGEAPRADHQRWNEFLPQTQYAIHTKPALVTFHPDLPPSYVWGFNGQVQGPTILERYGRPTVVRFYNELNATHTGPGVPEITVHMHNGHTASESDGFAGDYFGTGLFKDNHYVNIYAGYDNSPQTLGDPFEAQYTYWYHDH